MFILRKSIDAREAKYQLTGSVFKNILAGQIWLDAREQTIF